MGQAQSGTGQTATYVIGCLQRTDLNLKVCQGLILASTRELASQIQQMALALGAYNNVKCHACKGDEGDLASGAPAARQDIAKLREGQHLVIGTPAQVAHLLAKRHLEVDALKCIVLD